MHRSVDGILAGASRLGRLVHWVSGAARAQPSAIFAPDRRLQRRVLLCAGAVLALLWGGTSLYLAEREGQEIDKARHDTANLALAFEQHVERTIRGVDQVMLFIKADYERNPRRFDLRVWLDQAAFLKDLSLQISISDAAGQLVMSTLAPTGSTISLEDREHFRVHAEGRTSGLFISAPVLGRVSGKWSVQMTRRLSAPDGGFAGIIVISLDPIFLSSRFDGVDLGAKGVITVLGTDGVVRARSPLDQAQMGTSRAASPAFIAMSKASNGTHEGVNDTGPVIRSFRHVRGLPLIVTVSVNRDEVLTVVADDRRVLAALVIPLSVLTLILSGGFIGEIERRQHQQSVLARQSADLDAANKAVARANLELEDKVLERTAELEASRQRLETTLEQLTAAGAELAAQEKMASLGRVVAGVAHEVNTPLGVAITASSSLAGSAKAMGRMLADGTLRRSELTDFIAGAGEAADMVQINLARAAQLVRSFKQVAADQHGGEARQIELGAYLLDIMTSLNPEIRRYGHAVSVTCAEPINLCTRVDALWQVVSNLVMNALLHAYPDRAHGQLQLALARRGDRAVICFRDDGQGMSADVRDNIFEPFFTTKRGNGGTGLGLSIVFTLVTQVLGGQIACLSEPGAGTEFVVTLPVVAASVGAAA